MKKMDISAIVRQKEFFLQFAHECLLNSRKAINCYSETKNIHVALQFMNQAFQCIKIAQSLYLQICDRGEIQYFEDFFHQFNNLNQEFLEALNETHSFQHSLDLLDGLEEIYQELKSYFHM
ncbi:hypothetical protein [Brevibacillus sp. H7]|uniref:hypothetical protein n=1 Tax=Brevibacillus sp. H7 TaxID=3349138 RepID=UPI0037FE3B1C